MITKPYENIYRSITKDGIKGFGSTHAAAMLSALRMQNILHA